MAFIPRTSTTNPSNIFDSSSVYNNPYYCSGNGKINDHNANTYQCTYYAIARAGEIAGEPVTTYVAYPSTPTHRIFTRSGFGDAENWYNDTLWSKSTNINEPKIGALVIYSGSGWGVAGGHVMVIEAIDGDTIYMSENMGCFRSTWYRTWTKSQIQSHGFIGYIYNPYIDEPVPPGPEPYSISLAPRSKSIFIPKDGDEFLLTFDMTGTPYSGRWNWYPYVSINGNGITLDQQTYGPGGYPWVYTEYTGQDGNRYINTHAEFKVKLSWLESLQGTTGTYTIIFTQYSTDDSSTRQSITLTINYEYDIKKGAVLFLRYDGGDVQIR